MNKKNKGFTTIELITSFTLASVIMLILFNIILILKDNLSKVNAKTNMLINKDNLSYNINKRFNEKEISSVTLCDEGDKCYEFTYSDSTSDKLIYSNADKTITFNNYTFDIIDGITVEKPVITEHYDTMSSTKYNGYFIINIPIKIDNKDYSIKINKHFNTDSMMIDLSNSIYDDNDNKYVVVDYLESTGTQWIDTGVKLTENSKVELEMKITSQGNYSVFGSRTSATENNYGVFVSGNDYYLDFNNYQNNRLIINSSHEKKKILMSNKELNINDEQYSIKKYNSFETPENAFLFYMSGNPPETQKNIANMRVYKLKIYDNDTIIRDYIPVKDSNNIGCLFDRVSKSCFYSESDDDFVYYPVSNKTIDDNYSELSFIQFTGNQYIDTGVKPNGNLHTQYKLKFSSDFINNSLQINGTLYNELDFATGIYQNKWFFRYGSESKITNIAADNRIHVFDLSSLGGYVDNLKIADYSSKSFQIEKNLFIGARNKSPQIEGWCYERLYNAKIYDNNTLIRDYVPAIDSSNRPCLFDKVEKKCYYNQGTGEFLYG